LGCMVFGRGVIVLGIRQIRLGEHRSERFIGVALLMGRAFAAIQIWRGHPEQTAPPDPARRLQDHALLAPVYPPEDIAQAGAREDQRKLVRLVT
jgi:hypothetical protein